MIYRALVCFLALAIMTGTAFITTGTASAQATKPPSKPTAPSKPDFPSIADVVKKAQKLPKGFLQLYKKDDALYAEIPASAMNRPFMLSASIARGVGQGSLVAGMTVWESLMYWKLADKKVFLVEENVRHMAQPKSPIKSAVDEGFGDSIIAALNIKGKTGGTYLVNLTDFLFTDYMMVGNQLSATVGGGYRLDRSRTTWGPIKLFPENMNLEVAATYSGSSARDLRTVADARAIPINTFFSFSKVPNTGYRPRLADERVGHFLTVKKDYSIKGSQQPFVRYINRWHIEKADPRAEISPPKRPIVFHIEKSVPYEYRPVVREAILEWNKAFEKAGIIDAIEVRYQEDDSTWDAEDVRYNTVRWMTGESTFAIGPSRVNPKTGEIYDADILVASSWLQYFEQTYENLFAEAEAMMADEMDGKDLTMGDYIRFLRHRDSSEVREREEQSLYRCEFATGFRQQLAIAALAQAADLIKKKKEEEEKAENGDEEEKEKKEEKPKRRGVPQDFITQGLKELIMHEVGHTLGLRHNFKASSMLDIGDLHNKEIVEERGLLGSVMDYSLVNIAPEGVEQGYYFTPTLGPWDYLVIDYAYRPISGGEQKALKEIAAKAAAVENAYATDGDLMRDFDPLTNMRDMSSDPLAYAVQRSEIIESLWDGLVERVTVEGEGYQKVRTAFYITLADLQNSHYFASRYIGGIYFNRNFRGDPDERPIFDIVGYQKQHEALKFVVDEALSDDAYDFDPEMLARLAPNRWDHWGSTSPFRLDVPIHSRILQGQARILSRLFSTSVLTRIHDGAMYAQADTDVFTIDELYGAVTEAIWSELAKDTDEREWSAKDPFISSYRRDLQRYFFKYFLLEDVLNPWPGLPQDSRSVAWTHLGKLQRRIDTLLEDLDADDDRSLDALSAAHLRETQVRIAKAMDAAFSVINY